MGLPHPVSSEQEAALFAIYYLEEFVRLGGTVANMSEVIAELKRNEPPRIILLSATVGKGQIMLHIRNDTGGDMLKPDTVCFRYSDNGVTYHSAPYQLQAGVSTDILVGVDTSRIDNSGTILVFGVFDADGKYWHRYNVGAIT